LSTGASESAAAVTADNTDSALWFTDKTGQRIRLSNTTYMMGRFSTDECRKFLQESNLRLEYCAGPGITLLQGAEKLEWKKGANRCDSNVQEYPERERQRRAACMDAALDELGALRDLEDLTWVRVWEAHQGLFAWLTETARCQEEIQAMQGVCVTEAGLAGKWMSRCLGLLAAGLCAHWSEMDWQQRWLAWLSNKDRGFSYQPHYIRILADGLQSLRCIGCNFRLSLCSCRAEPFCRWQPSDYTEHPRDTQLTEMAKLLANIIQQHD